MLTLLLAHTNLICQLDTVAEPYTLSLTCSSQLAEVVNQPKPCLTPLMSQPPTTVPSVKIRRHRNKTEIHLPIPFSTLAQEA